MSFWSAQCELCESCPAHQELVFPFPCCCVSVSCARDCVFLTRDMACTTAQEISRVHLIPHGSGGCVFVEIVHGSACLEERLRQTEDVLVAERLAWQTAQAAQQTVGPQPQPACAGAGGCSERPPGLPSHVDTKAIGKPPTFSGDVDVNGQPESMPLSRWSIVFRS